MIWRGAEPVVVFLALILIEMFLVHREANFIFCNYARFQMQNHFSSIRSTFSLLALAVSACSPPPFVPLEKQISDANAQTAKRMHKA